MNESSVYIWSSSAHGERESVCISQAQTELAAFMCFLMLHQISVMHPSSLTLIEI